MDASHTINKLHYIFLINLYDFQNHSGFVLIDNNEVILFFFEFYIILTIFLDNFQNLNGNVNQSFNILGNIGSGLLILIFVY